MREDGDYMQSTRVSATLPQTVQTLDVHTRRGKYTIWSVVNYTAATNMNRGNKKKQSYNHTST
jgi:hypothetical protein